MLCGPGMLLAYCGGKLMKCLQGVEFGSIECMRLDFTEAISNQVPVKDTVLFIFACCQSRLSSRSEKRTSNFINSTSDSSKHIRNKWWQSVADKEATKRITYTSTYSCVIPWKELGGMKSILMLSAISLHTEAITSSRAVWLNDRLDKIVDIHTQNKRFDELWPSRRICRLNLGAE